MLKLYTDLSLLKLGGAISLLVPFIGISDYDKDPTTVYAGRFDDFYKNGGKYIQLCEDINDSDAAILPVSYPDMGDTAAFNAAIAPFLEKVKKSGKKIFVFTGHDVQGVVVPIENAIIFDGAMNKSTQPKNSYSWPHFFEDFIERYADGKVVIREKQALPVIGFCGFVPPIGLKMGKEKIIATLKLLANYAGIMRRVPHLSSHSYRARAVIAIKRSKKVVCNFRIKSDFGFGPWGLNSGDSKESNADFRKNFVNNIIESDYTLCVRGIGNNSIRFFETLCCGRIPVFVDTNSVLPLDHLIDWKKFSVWVEEKDIDNVAEIVAAFHERISPEEFSKMQQEARAVWVEYLSPTGFFKNLKKFL